MIGSGTARACAGAFLALLACAAAASADCTPPPYSSSGNYCYNVLRPWCESNGGTYDGTCKCIPGPNFCREGGGYSGGGSYSRRPTTVEGELGRQIGALLGRMLVETLFGSPADNARAQAEARRQAAEKAQANFEQVRGNVVRLLTFPAYSPSVSPPVSKRLAQSGWDADMQARFRDIDAEYVKLYAEYRAAQSSESGEAPAKLVERLAELQRQQREALERVVTLTDLEPADRAALAVTTPVYAPDGKVPLLRSADSVAPVRFVPDEEGEKQPRLLDSGVAVNMATIQSSMTESPVAMVEGAGSNVVLRKMGERAAELSDTLVGVGDVVIQAKTGGASAGTAAAIDRFIVAKLPIPALNLQVAQYGGKIVSATTKEATIQALIKMNNATAALTGSGETWSHADAEAYLRTVKMESTFGQRVMFDWLGW
jgi:hypothetical protein